MKQFDKKGLNFSQIPLDVGSIQYPDWEFNEFLMKMADGTLYDLKETGYTKASFSEIKAHVEKALGKPTYMYESSRSETNYKSMNFTDGETFYCRFVKNKTENETSRCEFEIYSTNRDIVDKYTAEIAKLFTENKREDNDVFVISSAGGNLTLNNLGNLKYSFIQDNYEDKVLKGFEYVSKEFNAENPNGRITIINGPPGGGKTNLIKGLISDIKNCLTILLPSKFVIELDTPGLVSLLIEERATLYLDDDSSSLKRKSILFVVEDADDCLVPRDGANMSTISSLLNYTDGIFGSMLDLRIIATTNADHMNFDQALLRPGRLCRHIVVEALSPNKATQVYKRLSNGREKVYNKPTTLAQIYADVKGGFENADIDKKVVGF
jgi:hypothetical protein